MRYRWMYYATGLPGWMRYGFSPGWAGRSPMGLGPCAQYLFTGQWPTPQMAAWQAGAGYPGAWTWPTAAPGTMAPEAELSALRAQAETLQAQLEAISKRIEELEKRE